MKRMPQVPDLSERTPERRSNGDALRGAFSGHETFACRYSWPKKGVDAVTRDSAVFADDSAMVVLGVGKNMVRSIRHWCLTARLIEPDFTIKNNRGRRMRVTSLGNAIFGTNGTDPYLEDPGTIWLLHWLITTNPERAATWRWAFGNYARQDFTRPQFIDDLAAALAIQTDARVTIASLDRDVETFFHTYVPARVSRTIAIEDVIDCPLAELRLIRESPLDNSYSFARGPKPTLSDEVLAYAIIDYWQQTAPLQASLSFEDLMHRPRSPGRVFKLDETSLADRLERASNWSRGALQFDETAGLRQLMRRRTVSPLDLLNGRARKTKGTA